MNAKNFSGIQGSRREFITNSAKVARTIVGERYPQKEQEQVR